MTRVRTQHRLSRLFLSSLSSASKGCHLRQSLVLLLLGLTSVHGFLSSARAIRIDFRGGSDYSTALQQHVDKVAEGSSSPTDQWEGDWSQAKAAAIENSHRQNGEISKKELHYDESRQSEVRDESRFTRTIASPSENIEEYHSTNPGGESNDRRRFGEIGRKSSNWLVGQREKRQIRGETDPIIEVRESVVGGGEKGGGKSSEKLAADRNVDGIDSDIGRPPPSPPPPAAANRSRVSLERNNAELDSRSSLKSTGTHPEEDYKTVGRSRTEKQSNENSSTAGGYKTAEETSRADGNPELAAASNESNEEPFTGFEGSQKFPVRVTYKPPVVPPVEKIDRRHFGPQKEDSEDATSTGQPSTIAPDLPKSPGRDVLNRHRKVEENSEDAFEEDRKLDVIDAAAAGKRNDTVDNPWLPGTLPGRRSSNLSPGKAVTEEKYESALPTMSPISPASTSAGENDSAIGLRASHDEDHQEGNGDTLSDVRSITKINVTILGLFELTRGTEPRPEGPSELQAAKLAIERINQMNVLPKFRLRFIYNDTKCDPGVGVDRFFHALYSAKKSDLIPLLLGTACSEVTETLAKIVPYWNIIQVSFGSTAPALSDSTEFPLFLRTVAPDSSHNSARIALIKHFGWDTVTALSQTGDMYSLAVNDLVTELEQANITCTATITFAENDYKEQLRTLKELDTRIIIGSFSHRLAPRVFCEAWKLGMHGGDYAWILPDDTIDPAGMTGAWWHSGPEECTPSQLSQTLDSLIIVKSHGAALGNEISSSGLTTGRFIEELAKRGVTHSKFAGQTYDAVWAMALALGRAEVLLNQENISLAEYTHARKDLALRMLEQLRLLRFVGVSGPVSFDGPDRTGITAFYQRQGHGARKIAIFNPEDSNLVMNCPGCAATRWPGGHPPTARRVFRLRVVTVAPAAFLAVTCLASIGVTLALAFLAFNLRFRRHKRIKLSSPRLNNMAAVGCGLVYGAVILLGLDHATLPDSDGYYPAVCTARVYLLSAGFSLAFGSMFTKTYRVHRIFTRSRSGVVKNKLLQDTQLISLIFVLLLIDGLVVTLWVTLDPMQRHLRNLTLEINPQDRGVVYQPQVEVCRSQHTNGWLGALYAYKGLLLLVGVYMAWETRHVKIPALNDSQYIGISVYSVVITSGIVVVLANLMSDRATLAFVMITALILASTTATLALLFLPQLANILAGERADPVVESLGLKIECNTRRFVTNDRRELQYRVEVQNRVYRREMAKLELELAQLEKELAREHVEPSHASSSASIPQQRNPSIGGGLPLLLLSVLPPVIPRASWPSADPSGIRRGTVAFSSQPDLEPAGPRRSLADIYKLQRRRDTEGPNRLGVFQRLFSLFGSRPSSRKTSTASFTGVASALRVHMGYIAGLVPGAKAASTCQVDAQGTRPPHPRCGSGPIISITSEEDRRLSLGLRRKECSEPRVNFSLPPHVSVSNSSSREKIRGSPRFPHRIVPASSLNAVLPGTSGARPHRWHSMEDAIRTKVSLTPRGSSCSPSCDVYPSRELGIPLSELLNSAAWPRKPPESSLAPTVTAETAAAVEDSRLGSDLRKLFKEHVDSREGVSSPIESEINVVRSTSFPSSSSTNARTLPSDAASPRTEARTSATLAVSQPTVNTNAHQEREFSRPTSPMVVVTRSSDHLLNRNDMESLDCTDTSCDEEASSAL